MRKGGEKRERLSREERRARIIDAALRLFADKGFSGTRTREVAQLAGISETLIFQHFKTKEDLYDAALKELFGQHPVMPELNEKMAQKDDFGVFSTLALHLIKYSRQDRRFMRLAIFNALERSPLARILRHHRHRRFHRRRREAALPWPELLGPYIQRRIDEGAFKSANAEIVARLFVETVYGYVLDQEASLIGPPLPVSDEEVVETLVRIFLDGLKA